MAELVCPHCDSPIVMREIKHDGWLVTRRTCPFCSSSFDLDAKTRIRQVHMIAVLILSLVFTVLVYFKGRAWVPFAIACYILAAGVLYYGNKKMYLVKSEGAFTRRDR